MRFIAITSPKVINEDVYLIKSLLERGIDIIHLRKPDSSANECRKLLKVLTNEERAKIIIHNYPELYEEFSLKGIHINKNITTLPSGYYGFKTRSCHSFEEIIRYKSEFDYLFLSPIFDSISKEGYKSKFSEKDLKWAMKEGIINEKIIALGGITLDKTPYLKSLNFGGIALSGAIYNKNAIKQLKYLSE